MGNFHREQGRYTRIYEEAYGDPVGSVCVFCGEPILHRRADSERDPEEFPHRWSFTVEHIDGNPENDDPANLAPAHMRCNASGGARRQWAEMAEQERRDRIVLLHKATHAEKDERGYSKHAVELGRKHGPAVMAEKLPDGRSRQAAKMGRIASAQRWRCGGCDKVCNAGPLATHQKATGHSGRTRLQEGISD